MSQRPRICAWTLALVIVERIARDGDASPWGGRWGGVYTDFRKPLSVVGPEGVHRVQDLSGR